MALNENLNIYFTDSACSYPVTPPYQAMDRQTERYCLGYSIASYVSRCTFIVIIESYNEQQNSFRGCLDFMKEVNNITVAA